MGIIKRIKRITITAAVGAVLLYFAGLIEGRIQMPKFPAFSFHFFGDSTEEPEEEQPPGRGDYRYYLQPAETKPQDAPQTTVWSIGA